MKGWLRFLVPFGVAALLLSALVAPAAADATGPVLVQTIKVPGTPGRFDLMPIDPVAHLMYISDGSNQTLDVLDLTSGSFVAQIPGLPNKTSKTGAITGANGVAIASDLKKVFVADEVDNSVHVYDTATNTQTAVVPTTQDGADSVSYDPVDRKVYVSNGGSGTITVLDATSNMVLTQISLPGSPEISIWDPFDHTIRQNLSDTNQQAVIDPKTDKIMYVFNLVPGCTPHGLGINPANQHMIVGCKKQMTVTMDGGDGSLLSMTRHVGGSDLSDYDSFDNHFYTASSDFKQGPVVGVFDATTNDWIMNVALPKDTGSGAHSLAVDPSTGKIYVLGQKTGTIFVFAPASSAK